MACNPTQCWGRRDWGRFEPTADHFITCTAGPLTGMFLYAPQTSMMSEEISDQPNLLSEIPWDKLTPANGTANSTAGA